MMFQRKPFCGRKRLAEPGSPAHTIIPPGQPASADGWRNRRRHLPAMVLLAALSLPLALSAAEVAGVNVAETVQVGNSTLVLNGAGVRSKLFIKVYVGALYVVHKSSSSAAVLGAPGPQRVELRLLRDLDSESLQSALVDGLASNHDAGQLAAMQARIDALSGIMRGIGKVQAGDIVAIDLLPDGVQVALNGQARGRVAGAGFASALLKVWLGDKPADAALKQAMLGAGSNSR